MVFLVCSPFICSLSLTVNLNSQAPVAAANFLAIWHQLPVYFSNRCQIMVLRVYCDAFLRWPDCFSALPVPLNCFQILNMMLLVIFKALETPPPFRECLSFFYSSYRSPFLIIGQISTGFTYYKRKFYSTIRTVLEIKF